MVVLGAVYGSMNRAGTKRARYASSQPTLSAAFGIVNQVRIQIDGENHTNMSFDIVGDCDDLVRGSKQPATRDENEAFAQNFHQAPLRRPCAKSGPRNMIGSDPAQPLAASFLYYPRDMQPQAQQDEPQARETTVRARTCDTVCADAGLCASSEAQLMSLAAHIKLPESQVIDAVFGLSPSALTLQSDRRISPPVLVCACQTMLSWSD